MSLKAIVEDENELMTPSPALLAEPNSFLNRLQRQVQRKDSRYHNLEGDETPSPRIDLKSSAISMGFDTTDLNDEFDAHESISGDDLNPLQPKNLG